MDAPTVDEKLKSCKHNAIEENMQDLTEAIACKSTPDIFGGNLVQSDFIKSLFLNEVLQTKGDGPIRMVQRLLTAVVAEIKTADTLQGCGERFGRFVGMIADELPDLSQRIHDRCADLERKVCELYNGSPRQTSRDISEPRQYLTKEEAEEKKKHLRSVFASLAIRTRKHFESTQVSLDLAEFWDRFILCLPIPLQEEHVKFFDEKCSEISRASSFRDFFCQFNRYWNYLNYNLLKYMIDTLGSKELQKEMEQYSIEVDHFRQATQLKVFCKIEGPTKKIPPPGFKAIATEHNITLSSTLQDLENIRRTATEYFDLPIFSLTFAKVAPGSVIVTWFLPISVVNMLLCGLTTELLEKLHIVNMKIVEDARPMTGKPCTLPAPQEPEVLNAAGTGRTARVEELVGEAQNNLNATEENGWTPLMWAAINGHTDTVECLIAAGAELNTLDKWERTALMYAARFGHLSSVLSLVEAGADIHLKDQDGWSALVRAAFSGHTFIVQALEEAGSIWPPLAHAAYHGDIERAVELFRAGGSQGTDGFTAIMLAAATDNVQFVESLKAAGADINFRTKSGWTPLMWASANNLTESQKVLLEAGADFNIQTMEGATALMVASQRGHLESLKVLLKAEADFNIQNKDQNGWTTKALTLKGHTESEKVLLDAGADFNIQNKVFIHSDMWCSCCGILNYCPNCQEGWTALMVASEYGHTESLKVLLKAGADANIQAKNGYTGLMSASSKGHTESQRVLLKAGADLNIQTEDGWTALMVASWHGHTESVKVLLKAGANFNIHNKVGQTALTIARDNSHAECVNCLLEASTGQGSPDRLQLDVKDEQVSQISEEVQAQSEMPRCPYLEELPPYAHHEMTSQQLKDFLYESAIKKKFLTRSSNLSHQHDIIF